MRYEKADNLLQLALEMQAARSGVSLQDIENKFQVGRRTAMRMRDAVLRNFPQSEEISGPDKSKRWRIAPGTLNRMVNFSAEELAALEVAIRLLERDNRSAESSSLNSLASKLKIFIEPGAARRLEPDLEALLEAEGLAMRPGPRPVIKAQVIEELRQAIKACHKVEITYHNRRKGESKPRVVHPYGFLHGHRNYLVAWHENPKANEMVLFSLPHIEKVRVLEASFIRDSEFNLQDFAARSFGLFQEEPKEIVWLFRPEAAREAADFVFHPSQKLEYQKDGSLKVSFKAGGLLEMAWHLYCWGDKVKVLSPPELAEMAHPQQVGWQALP